MCARFVIALPKDAMERLLQLPLPEDAGPRYNVAPTQDALVIGTPGDQREAFMARWGLVPSWAKDPSIGQRMINARSETVLEKPAYRASFRHRRCAVPTTGFIEWSGHVETPSANLFGDDPSPARKLGPKQPYLISIREEPVTFLAGLWDVWHAPDGNELSSFTVLTTEPNELMAELHNRMPCLLDRDSLGLWLHAGTSERDLLALTAPYPADRMQASKIDPAINNPRVDRPELLLPR